MNEFVNKIKEVCFAVLPIVVIVLLLNFFVSPIEPIFLIRFLIGTVFIIIGLSIFLFGIDIGVAQVGDHMGKLITKPNKLLFVILGGLFLGFFISVAEPDLHILANQVDSVTAGTIPQITIVIVVSIGIAVMLAGGLGRILYGIPLYIVLIVLYSIILVLSLFTSPAFLAISFDASGATTGALTVPFILALALGVTAMKRDSKGAEKDSFGLVAIASAGAIIAVMVMSIITGQEEVVGKIEASTQESLSVITPFIKQLPHSIKETAFALAPLVAIFLVFQFVKLKLHKHETRKILFGLAYTYLGLMLFMTGVNAGFMDVGAMMGYNIATMNNPVLLVGVGFVLGLATVLAEPAVHVLADQIEDVTSGSVKRAFVFSALCIGVGLAVMLSMMRVLIPELSLWHILLPGYIISLALAVFGPKLFVGIAFDAGGVATGPMTATFILAFAQGAADGTASANVLVDGFGIIALIALTPIITLQILGLIYQRKSKKRSK